MASDPQAFDEHLIGRGLLLPNQQGRRLSLSDNPFESARLEFDGLSSPDTEEHQAKKIARKPPEEAAAEKLEEAKKAQEEPEKKREKPKQGGRTQAKREQ